MFEPNACKSLLLVLPEMNQRSSANIAFGHILRRVRRGKYFSIKNLDEVPKRAIVSTPVRLVFRTPFWRMSFSKSS